MEMPKPSAEMVEVFQSVAPGGPDAVQRKMFGAPAAFVNGNMFMGLFGDELNIRLSPEARQEALAAGAMPFTPMGRPFKEYVVLSPAMVRDPAQLRAWVARAYADTSALPPKEAKKPAAKGR
jgi:TfoX/Sxy family transcriptional regulator of competence genes